MQELKTEQVEIVNGGIVNFLGGWAVGNALNYVVFGGAYSDAFQWSQGDFSSSNAYFMNNRNSFNLMY